MATAPLNVLVSGGAGYIGSHTVLELLGQGMQVVVLDNLSNAYKAHSYHFPNETECLPMECELTDWQRCSWKSPKRNVAPERNLPESLKRVEKLANRTVAFEECDVKDKSSIAKVFKKYIFHFVIHFAALKAVGESVIKPLEYYETNVGGTLNLLNVMRSYNVRNFIFSSSATVYGDPKALPFTEDMPTGNCTNPYGKSKYMVEEILRDYSAANKEWSVISLRYFNPVGAHPSGEIGEDPTGIPNNLMPFIAQVAVGKRKLLQVYGNDYDTPDGTGVRDYIHITDLASGHVKAINYQQSESAKGFHPINLGVGKGYSVLEVREAFEKVSGKAIPYEIVAPRAGDIAVSYADPSLAKKLLNWTATKTLDEMCADSWNWQRRNPNGYRPIGN